ncbi:MAG: hypothetical protein P8013_05905 [Candidatus Sulfobium sp.]
MPFAMVLDILKECTERFSIVEVLGESSLAECCRTSFTWSEIPGSLCLAMDKQYFLSAMDNENIMGIIAPPAAVVRDHTHTKGIVVSSRANDLFYYIHNLGIHRGRAGGEIIQPYIDPSARIAPSAIIDKNVVIEENVIIYDNCIVRDGSVLGKNSVLYENVIVGSEGFFSKVVQGEKIHVKHFGGVKIGSNCMIHASTNIARSVNHGEYTILGDNVHVGGSSNVGHDCRIEDNTDISVKVLLAGRVRIGKGCWIGASVSVSNAVSIGANASIKIGSVVIDDVEENGIVSGNFALPHSHNLKKFLKTKRDLR